MASLRSRLRKFATRSELYAAMAGTVPVPVATRDAAGLMSPEMARKLARVEDNATGDMTAAEIVRELQRLTEALDLDVRRLEGRRAADFAPRDHKHDDRYMPADQVKEHIEQVLRLLEETIKAAKADILDVTNAADLTFQNLSKQLQPEALAAALADLKQTSINAGRIGGLDLEQLDQRYERVGSRPQERSLAVNGGVVKSGQFSPDVSKNKLWRYANGGDHVFRAPATKDDYEVKVAVLHTQSAGRVTFEGFGTGPKFLDGEHYKNGAHLFIVTKIGPYLALDVRLLKEPELHG